MGYGEFESKIQSLSKSYNNIFFHEAVSPDVVLNYTASADVGIALIENTCLSYNFCMPNKLFEYAMSGLPVIVSDMIEMSNFVKTHQMGITIMNDTVENVNFTIDKLLSMDLNKLKQNAKKAAWQIYGRIKKKDDYYLSKIFKLSLNNTIYKDS